LKVLLIIKVVNLKNNKIIQKCQQEEQKDKKVSKALADQSKLESTSQ